MSHAWLEGAKKLGVDVVGLVDIDEDAARKRAEEFGLAEAWIGSDLDAALVAKQPDLLFDVVVPEARFSVASAGLRHGCHVLSEKPMATSMAEARELVRRAKETGRIHAVIQNRRYMPQIRRIKQMLSSGILGSVTNVNCDFFLAPHFGGFREEMEHVLLLDMAIHTFDAARYLAGSDACGVYCREWNPPNSWFRHGACATATFDLDNGAVLSYRGSWCADGLMTLWESSWRIVCERGTLLWDGGDDMRAEGVVPSEGFFSELESIAIPGLSPNERIGGHLGVMEDFLDAVENGGSPETAGSENIKSLAMVFGAVESAEHGSYVKISELSTVPQAECPMHMRQ